MISAGNDVAVSVSGDGDEILDVVGRRCLAVWEEEGRKVGALDRAELGYRWEAANDVLDKQRAFSERGDGEEVDEVVPGLLVPQGAGGEAGVTAYSGVTSGGTGDTWWQGGLG